MECFHGFEDPSWCSYCKAPPKGIRETIYWTAGGDVFHNTADCELLNSGQHMANRVGMANHRIQTGRHGSVGQRGACPWCCALYYAEKKNENKRCLVRIHGNKEWVEARYLAARLLVPQKQIFEFRVITDDGQELIVRKPNITFSKDWVV